MFCLSTNSIGLPVCALTLIAIVLTSSSALAHKDRVETPQRLTINFKTGEYVAFVISKGTISAVTLHVGATDFCVPKKECDKLKDVHFETVALLWDGESASAAKASYFFLQFDMGSERKRGFGELPRVQLVFEKGKFYEATVTKKIAQDTWQDSKL